MEEEEEEEEWEQPQCRDGRGMMMTPLSSHRGGGLSGGLLASLLAAREQGQGQKREGRKLRREKKNIALTFLPLFRSSFFSPTLLPLSPPFFQPK